MFKVARVRFVIALRLNLHFFQNRYVRIMSTNTDDRLDIFRGVCDEIAEERSYLGKASILRRFFQKGSNGKEFNGDIQLWLQMLIPCAVQRVYNLQNKQMLKLFARIFACDHQEMQLDLEQEGDVSLTLCKFFEKSRNLKPQTESTLYLQEVEEFLAKLEQRSKEDEQTELLKQVCKQSTAQDLKMIIRIIKQDLRINAGARHILDALSPLAYSFYQSSRNLSEVVKKFANKSTSSSTKEKVTKAGKTAAKVGNVQVMTPISPMLANACKSVDEAFKKSPTGLFSEIKYDGERVQIHKKDNEFKFFSRNLKPVLDHKIKRLKEFIPKAFPGGGDMILDSEIILVDTKTGELLPFGSLGAHKKKEFSGAEVCLFVFDCILFNGNDLTGLSFRERRKILEDNIKPIQSFVQLSESHFLKTKTELSLMTAKVLKANLEGVVLKNPTGTYQPGKRGWLKVKKDYLFGGKMADTADLVVLGAWYGSGKKGGILSIFLMGCYDPSDRLWKTVTKVHSGLDDATNEKVHEELMQLMERANENQLPTWLLCKKALVPDYLAKEPTKMPVWEITGAEFTKSEAHTAAGISIRFPRITTLRADKSAEQANDLPYLQQLYEASKNDVNVDLLIQNCDDEQDDVEMEIDSKLKLNITPTKIKAEVESGSSKKKLKIESTEKESSGKKKMKLEEIDGKPPSETKLKLESSPASKKGIKLEYSDDTPSTSKKWRTEKHNKNENGSKAKQQTLNFSLKKSKESKESSGVGIFKDITAFFNTDCKDVSLFLANGGNVTEDARQADYVFHASTDVDVDLGLWRKKFKNSCRHLSVEWVRDSLQLNSCQPPSTYAVALKRNFCEG